MKEQDTAHSSRRGELAFWIIGLGSLIWLLLRSGSNPRRLAYPCQNAALVSSTALFGCAGSILGTFSLYRVLRRRTAVTGSVLLGLSALVAATFVASRSPVASADVRLTSLPGWTSETAKSNVFAVTNVPVPECSLEGGTLPSTSPCAEASYALRDRGVDMLIDAMERQGVHFHRTTTNTDVVKGLIWRILQHPFGFTGEVVIAENTQEWGPGWSAIPANAEDQNQSYRDVAETFQSLGYQKNQMNVYVVDGRQP